jgi:hypothetical protein
MDMSQINWSRIFKQADNIVYREIADETILVPIRGKLADMQNIFTLNKVGAYIWEKLDGTRNLEEILVLLLSHFEVNQEQAEHDLLEFIDHVAATGLAAEKM